MIYFYTVHLRNWYVLKLVVVQDQREQMCATRQQTPQVIKGSSELSRDFVAEPVNINYMVIYTSHC